MRKIDAMALQEYSLKSHVEVQKLCTSTVIMVASCFFTVPNKHCQCRYHKRCRYSGCVREKIGCPQVM